MEHAMIAASEMDSRVASLWPSITDYLLEELQPPHVTSASERNPTNVDFMQLLGRMDLAAAGMPSPRPARAANLVRMNFYNGVREFYDEHGALVRVDYGDDPYGRGRFGGVPASEAEIARLPKATACEVREKGCAVCLESIDEGAEELRKMTCPSSHGFHEKCIFTWLRVSRLCPLCRFALPAK